MFPRETIEGDGILLRPWEMRDIPVLPGLCDDPEIMRFMPNFPNPYTEHDAHQWVTERAAPSDGGVAFAIVDSESQNLLGGTGLGSVHSRRSQAEVGYWLGAHARGRGVARAAVNALAGWAFKNGVQRLELLAAKENGPSQRVALATGFKREGVRRHASSDRDGNRRDLVAFARLHDDPPGPVPRLLPDFPQGQLTDGTITLRPFRPDDVDDYLSLYQFPEVAASTLGGAVTRESAIRKCQTAESVWLAGEGADCIIIDNATGAFAGDISLHYWQPMLGETLLGYSLHPAFRGRGVMTRAVNLLVTWAFSEAGVVRVKAGTFPGNEASRRVLERAGFVYESTARALLPGPDGSRIDDVEYVRLSPRYQASVSNP